MAGARAVPPAAIIALHLSLASTLIAQGHGILPKAVEIGDLPPGFAEKIVARGIDGATGMTVAPDGRVFVCEQTGALRVVKNDEMLEEPFVRLEVDSYWERGLIGIALDPLFERNGHVYLHYTARAPYTHFRVSRFTADGDRAVPGSEKILIEGDDQATLGGRVPAGHQGGGMAFGNDGSLYIVIGEMTTGMPSQRLDTFLGKVLRIHPNGAIPTDNPFYTETEGRYRAIWAIGLRNPFAVSVERATGRIFVNDVGESLWEEIDEIFRGANYGWPLDEGPTDNPAHTGPVHAYVHHARGSISGGAFYQPRRQQFPESYRGKYFFAEYEDHWISVLDPARPEEAAMFASGLAGPVAIAVAPDGSLYYLNRNMWIKDEGYKAAASSLHKVIYVPNSESGAPRLADALADPLADRTAAAGEAVVFEVSATAARLPLSYQWLRNGERIPGATQPRYAIAEVKPEESGAEFRCIVSNPSGAAKTRAAKLWVTRLREPLEVERSRLTQGLDLQIHAGEFPALPDFDSLTAAATRTVREIDLAAAALPAPPCGLRLRGAIEVPKDGVYTFEVTSSGVSKLFVASHEVATASRAPDATRDAGSATGSVGLRRGLHSLLLLSIHGDAGKPLLNVRIAEPAGSFRPIAAGALFHGGNGDRVTPLAASRRLVTTLNVPPEPERLPRLLSGTGIFRSLAELSPSPGLVEYDLRVEPWADGARARRWIALPGDSTIEFYENRPWRFPAGTVFVQHFEIQALGVPAANEAQNEEAPSWRRLETRVLRVDANGLGYGATYRWRADGMDADLVTDGGSEELTLPGGVPDADEDFTWTYPRSTECLSCHSANASFVLGVRTGQIDRIRAAGESGKWVAQLEAWSRAGLFSTHVSGAREAGTRLAGISDGSASLDHRVRSYLDVNCAHCHRPGGPRGKLDARLDAPKGLEPIFDASPGTIGFGISGARVVARGDPYRSTLYYRLSKLGLGSMPPLGSGRVDERALIVIREWIASLRENGPASVARRERALLQALETAASDPAKLDLLISSNGDALALADLVSQVRPPARIRHSLVDRAGVHDDPRIRGLFERFLPRERRIQRIGPVVDAPRILALAGNPDRGRRLFAEAAGLRCSACHADGGAKRKVGPDLGQIAEKHKTPDSMLAAIATPSKEIDPQYQTQIVLTSGGEAITGIVIDRTGESIAVVDEAGTERRLTASDVLEVLPQPQSLMPEGLLRNLTHQQAADLLAFLMKESTRLTEE